MLPKIAKEWIEKAEEDYGFASASIECTDYFAQICFHFQQAAEKYLKAFIVANKLDFRPIHNLLELLAICSQDDPDIKELEEAC
jgi:HEPN domain-containing protein